MSDASGDVSEEYVEPATATTGEIVELALNPLLLSDKYSPFKKRKAETSQHYRNKKNKTSLQGGT